jgi:V8-like Glu-specific endopeptidase
MVTLSKGQAFRKILAKVLLSTTLLLNAQTAVAQPSANARGDDSVIHDLGSGQTWAPVASPVARKSPPPPSPPARGLGPLESSSPDAELSATDRANLSQAKGSLPAYEAKGLRRDENDDYIPQSVIGQDQREPVADTRNWPHGAITQISFRVAGQSTRSTCTGALIARDVVLTAGHCVFSGNAWHLDFAIYPGRSKTALPFGKCGAKRLYSVGGWVNSPGISDESKLYDIGAIKLDCNVGDRTSWFVMKASESIGDTPTTILGYPHDPAKFAVGTQVRSQDKIRKTMNLKIFYRNDTFFGMSGSPVFLSDDVRSIYAIHTNGLHCCGVWSENNAATRLTAQRISNIVEWMGE